MTTLQEVNAWLTEPAPADVTTALTVVEDSDASVEVPTETAATTEPPSAAMARLLEIAVRNAEELVAEATTEAEQLTASARVEADEMLAEARRECEQVRTETDRLRQSEAKHQERMRHHLTTLLEKLEAAPSAV